MSLSDQERETVLSLAALAYDIEDAVEEDFMVRGFSEDPHTDWELYLSRIIAVVGPVALARVVEMRSAHATADLLDGRKLPASTRDCGGETA